MSLNCTLYEILPEEARLIEAKNPEQYYRLRRELHGDVPDEDEAYVGLLSVMRVMFLNLDMDSLFDPEAPEPGQAEADDDAPLRGQCELGDSWHGLHYILNHDELPDEPPELLDFLLAGGDHWDWGQHGYRYFTPEYVDELSAELTAFPAILFKERYHPIRMENIHPKQWANEADFEWLVESFVKLRSFINECAEKGSGMVVTVS